MIRHSAYSFLSLAFQTSLSLACTAVSQVHLTNYGFPDASSLTQFACSGSTPQASYISTPLGEGTYASPYAFAASGSGQNFRQCETIYIPYLKKYFKFSDLCAQCGMRSYIEEFYPLSAADGLSESDEAENIQHIDLYLIQSNADIGQSSCEKQFGRFGGSTFTVIRDPDPNLPIECETNQIPLSFGPKILRLTATQPERSLKMVHATMTPQWAELFPMIQILSAVMVAAVLVGMNLP